MTCAAYARVSTTQQADQNGTAAQRVAIERWAAREGVGPLTWFEDAGVSGATMKRPAWDRLQTEIRAGRIKTLVVYSLSRAGRSLIGLLQWLEEMRARKVRLVFLTENLDTSTPMGRAMFAMTAVFAQLEREITAERVRDGVKAFRAAGGKFASECPGRLNKHGTTDGMLKVTDDQVRSLLHLSSPKAAVLLGISEGNFRRRRGRLRL